MKKISFEEAIKYLNEGKKIYTYNLSFDEYWIINNNILCKYTNDGKLLKYNDYLYYDCEYYLPEETKPFKITKTGLYKTRDGRQAYVSYIGEHPREYYNCVYLIIGYPNVVRCNIVGRHYTEEDPYDLISEWSDENADN